MGIIAVCFCCEAPQRYTRLSKISLNKSCKHQMNSRLSSDLPQQNGKTVSFETNLNPRFQKVSALHSKSRSHTSQFIDKEVHLDGAPQSSYPVDETAFRFRVHQWCLLEIHSHHRGLRMRCVYLKVIPSRGSFHTIMCLRAVFKGEREAWKMHLKASHHQQVESFCSSARTPILKPS